MKFTNPAATVLASYHHARSRERFEAVAADMGVDGSMARMARENLVSGQVRALVVSGPQASGKDTVGPAVLAAVGAGAHVRIGIADGLKQEVSDLLVTLNGFEDQETAALAASALLEVGLTHARFLVAALWGVTLSQRTV